MRLGRRVCFATTEHSTENRLSRGLGLRGHDSQCAFSYNRVLKIYVLRAGELVLSARAPGGFRESCYFSGKSWIDRAGIDGPADGYESVEGRAFVDGVEPDGGTR